MITVYINNQPSSIEPPCSLQDILVKNHQDAPHIAIAINNRFVPRTSFAITPLEDGDRIDLIVPMQGG